MIKCATCIHYEDCVYKEILYKLNESLTSGVAESKAPFTCDLSCNKYVTCNANPITIPYVKKCNWYYKIKIKKSIIKSLLDTESEDSYILLDIVKTTRIRHEYLAVSYARPTIVCATKEDVLLHQYMIVSSVYIDDGIVGGCNYRINLAKPEYFHTHTNKRIYRLSDRDIHVLMHLLTRNNGKLYGILCAISNNMIFNQYWHLKPSSLSEINIPNYFNLNKCDTE